MTENTGGILLGIIGFVVVATTLFFVFGKGEIIENSICKATVYFSDQTGGEGDFIPYLDVNPILCRTHYKELDSMNDLAETMVTTWDIWGEGELDPSGDVWLQWSNYRCFKQYKGEVTGDIVGITPEQFRIFLQNNGDVNDKTYWNYFNKGNIDLDRIVLNFDVLNKNDFITVSYFEYIKFQDTLFPNWDIQFYRLLTKKPFQDTLVVSKDNLNNPIDCVEIT